MSAKVKTVLKGFDYMHCDDFAKYLSDMAAKGWYFKEWGFGLKFEKGEPENAVYAVEVFQKASENDMRPEPNTQEFAEYCEAAGWRFLDAKQKFCIFKKIDEEATDLFTSEERVDNARKGSFSGTAIVLLVLYAVNALLRWSNLGTMFERNIFSGHFFLDIAIWTVLFIVQSLTLLYAAYKCGRLKKKARSGEKIYIGNRQDGKYRLNIKDVYIVLLMLLLMYYFFIIDQVGLIILNVAIIVGTIVFTAILNKVRPERDTNIIIQVVFAVVLIISIVFFTMLIFLEDNNSYEADTVPLVIADYRECDDTIEDTSYYEEHNFLGSVESYFIFGEKTSIRYEVYKSEYAWILDKIWKGELEGKKFNQEMLDCTEDWKAQKAFRNNVGTYYVRYENAILVFSDDVDVYLSKEQIKVILDKLELR